MFGKVLFSLRILALALATFGLYGIRLLTLPFTFAFPKLNRGTRRFLFRSWARLCARVFGMRIRVVGPRPKPPFFLVTNHLTYLDGLTLASQVDGVFVAKSEIASWPFVGSMAKEVNVIFVDRTKRSDTLRVNDAIERTIAGGEGVVMFAESTTSRGDYVQPFKTALFEAAAQNNYPVHYAAIHYTALPGAPPASEWITWWTDISFGAHIARALRQRGLEALLTFGDHPIVGTDRKLLAEQAHDAVQALFQPVK